MTLISRFGTLENIIKASETRLAECPGFGSTKAKKLYKALHEPFVKQANVNKNQNKNAFEGDLSIEDIEKLETEMGERENKAEKEDKIENQESEVKSGQDELKQQEIEVEGVMKS